jgi:hypothetical protein
MASLGLQEAVQRATEILEELYPDQELKHVLLEEIELGRGGTWYVTLGFTHPGSVGYGLAGLGPPPPSGRAYKTIKINAETGEFEGMTDRLLEESVRSQ